MSEKRSDQVQDAPICPYCKESYNAGATRCKNCGQFLLEGAFRSCPFCGRAIDEDARKCVHCNEFVQRDVLGLRGRSVYDAFSLLLVPVILMGLAVLIPRIERQKRENAESLTAYLDEMTQIILDEKELADG